MNFKTALKLILKWEGGYVDHPKDPGGETKYGISKRAFPHIDIKNLTKKQAENIYFEHYWIKAKCDYYPYRLSILMFDAAVQHGVKRSIKLLQKTLGVKQDGIFGKKSLAALRAKDSNWTATHFTVYRILYYTKLKPWHVFKLGWMRRVIDVYTKVIESDYEEVK